MSTLNKLKRVFTREGAPAKAFTPADELKRTLMNCLLWEDQFYEDGVAHRRPHQAAGAARRGRARRRARDNRARGHEAAPRAVARLARNGAPRHASRAGRRYAGARHSASRRNDRTARDLLGGCAGADAAAQEAADLGADQEGPGARGDEVRRLSARQIRSRRRGANPGRAVPGSRQAEGRRTGEGLEAARRGRAFGARHLGGLAFHGRREARDVRAADRREEARRPRTAAQPAADAEGGSPSRDDRRGDRGHARRSHSALPLHHGGAVCAGLRARTRSLRC